MLAMVNPMDVLTIDDVQMMTGLKSCLSSPPPGVLDEALGSPCTRTRARMGSPPAPAEKQEGASDVEVAKYGTVIALLEEILTAGMRQGASDIHFEPQEDGMVVRLRVDGVLHPLTEIRSEIKDGVVSRIKILADMDISERRLPQDGRASFQMEDRSTDLRIATIPTVFGENVTIRLLDDRMFNITLDDFGMGDHELPTFRKALNRPWGEILITGPTGSGKSTTLYAGLEELNNPARKIYTVEDPVERKMPGILQTQIRANIGLTFASMLRSLVRERPGRHRRHEVRDPGPRDGPDRDRSGADRASGALDPSHQRRRVGHRQAPGDGDASRTCIASALECVLAQRLARKLCQRCKMMVTLTPEGMTKGERQFLGVTEAVIARAVGCNHCFGTGYSGRIGLFELLPVDLDIRRLILENATAIDIRDKALSAGMRTLREDGRLKVLAGVTTIEEVERVTT